MPRKNVKKTDNLCSEPSYAPGDSIKFKHEDDANKLCLKLGNPMFFNQYRFEYLINPIVLKFKKCVKLKNMKNVIKIVGIQDEDAETLSKIIRRLHGGIRIRKNDTSVPKMNAVLRGYTTEYLEPTEIDGKDFLIDLEIQGYKTSDSGFPSPIWSIVLAQQNCL